MDSGEAGRDFSASESWFWFILLFNRLLQVKETSSVVDRSSEVDSGGLDADELLRGSLSGVFGESSGLEIWFSSSSLFSSANKFSSDSDMSSSDLGDIFGERTGRGLAAGESKG